MPSPTTERRTTPRYRGEVRLGLEVLGGEVLVEGHVEDLSTGGLRATLPSLLPEHGRAFAVITPSGSDLPIVGIVEVLQQAIVSADAAVELRATFVEMSEDNRARLYELCKPDTSGVAC